MHIKQIFTYVNYFIDNTHLLAVIGSCTEFRFITGIRKMISITNRILSFCDSIEFCDSQDFQFKIKKLSNLIKVYYNYSTLI